MNANANEAKNQQVPPARRGFLRKLSAAAGAAVATMTLPAATASGNAPSAPLKDAHGFAISVPYDDATMPREYNEHMLTHLCEVVGLLQELYEANKDQLVVICPGFEADLEDLVFESTTAANVVIRAANIKPNWSYVTKRGIQYNLKAQRGAA